MQTSLPPEFKSTEIGHQIDAILRSCVHCGFCNATCPTYLLLGDELDGPRGRIYQIKQMLETGKATRSVQIHLDRCLTCRNCETTCPSGVQYSRLLDVGREWLARKQPRKRLDGWFRNLLITVFSQRSRFTPLLRAGQFLRLFLFGSMRRKIPAYQRQKPWPTRAHSRKMIVLSGCVQPGIAPNINQAAAQVLDRLGIQLLDIAAAGCCGSMNHHAAMEDSTRAFARTNIDAWWPAIEAGAEAIVVTASGCGLHIKDYGHLLRHDKSYAYKAQAVATITLDIGEVVAKEDLSKLEPGNTNARIAYHPPCTLQHGQGISGTIEALLSKLGYQLIPFEESHLCCGSAGIYSILQPGIATQLRDRKLNAIQKGHPDILVTANIGCQVHLQSGTRIPVKHWIELL
ncbi:MAG: glycolate oxidase subunit GlcF [Acidiferrobacterales bacterium]